MSYLYENESPTSVYNPETGRDELPVYDAEATEETVRQLAVCSDVIKMATTRGWSFINSWMDQRVSEYRTKLENETDYDTIRRYQEAIKVYVSVTGQIQLKINEREILKDLINKDPEQG